MRKPRVSIRSVLIAINLAVLLLPLAGIQLMRLYESALIRQTESALIAQAAFIAAYYRNALREEAGADQVTSLAVANTPWSEGVWFPQPAQLDLAASPLLSPFPEGVAGQAPDSLARRVGERLMPVLKDAQLVTLAGIRVVDPFGVIVASTGDDVGDSIAAGEEVRLALQGQSASRLRSKSEVVKDSPLDSISRASGIRVFVASPIMLGERLVGGVLRARTPPSILKALYGKRWLLLQAFMLLVGIVLLMSWLTFRLIANPIRKLSSHATQVAQGGTLPGGPGADPLPIAKTKEVAELQLAITNMANTLEQRARYLQDFARHVSHEFKTPIASIQGAVEVLQDHAHDMPAANRERFLANIAADAGRLHRLTQRLMELSKAELNTDTVLPVDVGSVAARIAEQMAEDGFAISLEGFDGLPAARGSEQVLQAVLEILLENAQQHGATRVRMVGQEIQAPLRVSIQVLDNGAGISAGNRDKIFAPFFTTQREQGGTGLGLSIAQALLQQIDGELTLCADESGWTKFAVCCHPADVLPA